MLHHVCVRLRAAQAKWSSMVADIEVEDTRTDQNGPKHKPLRVPTEDLVDYIQGYKRSKWLPQLLEAVRMLDLDVLSEAGRLKFCVCFAGIVWG